MATNLLLLFAAAAAGALAGFAYFSILWGTIVRLPAARSPWRLMLAGYLARMALALTVFYILVHGPAARVAVALIAFLMMRGVVIRRAGRKA
ncbi:MAG TPA: ATP synthase subunit I [bacterium]|nr:ATP synthase subunit I [bacterium]